MDRDEAQSWFVELLLDKVRQDAYPSVVHLDMIEEVLPPEMVGDYLQVLMDRCASDTWPSVPLLRRIRRVASNLPASSSQAQS